MNKTMEPGEYQVSPKCKVEPALEVDEEKDGRTPDNWVPRNKQLIRLTGFKTSSLMSNQQGLHPLNAEPPIEVLMKEGVITPNSLHYVRNHGSVPKLKWETHKVSVTGLVKSTKEFSMDELASLPSINIPVTYACDGNRRKEINTIRHTKGFDWGTGGIGCAVWKGVKLCDLLARCGVDQQKGKFVHFEGSDNLANGKYGTSIPLGYAMNPDNDVMLAYEMNNEKIPPDHGFPVRVVIPGFVGGRMVKWLAKVEVSEKESDNWYHLHDNKVLPSHVDEYEADGRGWWKKNEYVLYEANVNSVITTPSHNDIEHMDNPTQQVTFRGYAYSGGGRKIIRVEISLDDEKTWEQCELKFPENAERHGYKCFVWCHWELQVPAWKVARSGEAIVRAYDASNNSQPSHPTWNVLGMLNNSMYRVKIVSESDGNKPPSVTFIHPVQTGCLFGGWMVKPEKEYRPSLVPRSIKASRQITMDEVAKHNTEKDCWIVIDGEVYDVSSYLSSHPGGAAPLLIQGGMDSSRFFHEIHAPDAYECKERFVIGTLVARPTSPMTLPQGVPQEEAVLNPRRWIDVTLVDKKEISPDTRIFTFQLPNKQKFGLPVGQHILLGTNMEQHFVVRPYTPISPVLEDEENGTFKLVVKIYFAGKSPVFPQGGTLTQYMEKLKIGDTMKVKGPAGPVFYHGHGNFTIHGMSFKVTQVSMVAGGTGITPMYQLAKAVLKDATDNTQVALIYANHSVDDILLREELEALAKDHPDHFKLHLTVSSPPKDGKWEGSVGRINKEMMKKQLFPASDDSLALMCGPPAMIEATCIPALEALGYTEQSLFEF